MAREVSSCWDRPVTDAELAQFNGVEITETAMAIGEQQVLADMDWIGEFIACASSERAQSTFFGAISTQELVALTFGENAPEKQRAEAAIEFRRRFLKEHHEHVMQRAAEVCA